MQPLVQQDPSVERKRRLAEAMVAKGQNYGPVQHWTQGLDRISSQLLGSYMGKQADKAQQEQQRQAYGELAKIMSGDVPADQKLNEVAQIPGINQDFVTNLQLQRSMAPKERDPIADYRDKKEIDAEFEGNNYAPFEGTGIEAQMLNIALDPNIPDSDSRKILARQRLEKPTTITTPNGTYVRPGYDLSAMSLKDVAAVDQTQEMEFIPKPATEGQALAEGYFGRMVNATQELSKLGDYDPVTPEEAGRGLTNITSSPEKQRYVQAASDWIRAKLRKESGAVIGPEEMKQEYETYFPILGDSKEVQEQKARARAQAEKAMFGSTSPKFQNEFNPESAPETAVNPRLEELRSKHGI